MHIINSAIIPFALACVISTQTHADSADHGHDSLLFHSFSLDIQTGGGRNGQKNELHWQGWLGGDIHKLWLQGELKQQQNSLEKAEFWALYSRQVHEFWDAQIGLRHDAQPINRQYLTMGFSGLAPYWFETQAHTFISDRGDVTARIEQKNHILFTQKLGLAPYYQLDFSAQRVEQQALGRGITYSKIGMKLFYEVHRKFSPYLDVQYEKQWGRTADYQRAIGNKTEDWRISLGVSLLF